MTKDDLELLSLLSLPLECWDCGHVSQYCACGAGCEIQGGLPCSRQALYQTSLIYSPGLGFKNHFHTLWGIFACLHVCVPQHAGPTEVRRGIGAPGISVRDSCELPCGWWELNSDPLEEQQVLLTNCVSLASSYRFCVCRSKSGSIWGKKGQG